MKYIDIFVSSSKKDRIEFVDFIYHFIEIRIHPLEFWTEDKNACYFLMQSEEGEKVVAALKKSENQMDLLRQFFDESKLNILYEFTFQNGKIQIQCVDEKDFDPKLLHDFACFLSKRNRFNEAIALNENIFEYYRKKEEKTHVGEISHSLANLLCKVGKYDVAQRYYMDAIRMYRNAEVFSYALACNDLANVYTIQRKYQQAEWLYKEVLSIQKKNLNTSSSQIAKTYNNLGYVCGKQRKGTMAEEFFFKALEYANDVSEVYHNLANVYVDQRRYEEAQKMFDHALNGRKEQSKINPEVANLYNDLAILYCRQGNEEKAQSLFLKVLTICKKEEDAYLPCIEKSCCWLGNLYRRQGCLQEAQKYYKEAFTLQKKLMQVDPKTYVVKSMRTCNDLAILYREQEKYELAQSMLLEALTIQKNRGYNDWDACLAQIANIFYTMATLNQVQDHLKEAKEYFEQSLEMYKKLEKENPGNYLSAISQLYTVLAALKDDETWFKQALKVDLHLMKINPSSYGGRAISSCRNLVYFYRCHGKKKEAEIHRVLLAQIRKELEKS